jgi:hypothetical protein
LKKLGILSNRNTPCSFKIILFIASFRPFGNGMPVGQLPKRDSSYHIIPLRHLSSHTLLCHFTDFKQHLETSLTSHHREIIEKD